MSIDLAEAFRDSADRMVSAPGGVAVALLFGYSLWSGVAFRTFVAEGIRFGLREAGYTLADMREEVIEQSGYAAWVELQQFVDPPLDVGFPVAVGLVVLLPFLSELVFVVAVRGLGAAGGPQSGFPTSQVTEGLPLAYIRSLVALVVVWVVAAIGFVLFVIPGLVLTVLFAFVRQRIVLGGDGIFEGISNSVSLVRENVLEVVVIWVVTLVLTLGGGFVFGLIPVQVVSTFLNVVVTIYTVSLITVAYQQAARTAAV